MNWETALQDTLLKCAAIESLPAIASLTDLTLLNSAATEADIKNLVTTALDNHVAAICVFPQHLSWVSDHLRLLLPSPSGRRCHAVTDEDFSGQYVPSDDTLIRPAGTFSQGDKGATLATVVNFPSGNESHDNVLHSIKDAITLHKADEIDYVFPYQTYLAGDTEIALSNCASAYQQSKQQGAIFKVILETGALPSLDIIYQLSVNIIENGCDFLKTSTGKIATGATLPAAFAMLKAIVDTKIPCGIKLSGGIKTQEQAHQYMRLAQDMTGLKLNKHWFRLGTSTMVA